MRFLQESLPHLFAGAVIEGKMRRTSRRISLSTYSRRACRPEPIRSGSFILCWEFGRVNGVVPRSVEEGPETGRQMRGHEKFYASTRTPHSPVLTGH
jgi:hypothetical protein